MLNRNSRENYILMSGIEKFLYSTITFFHFPCIHFPRGIGIYISVSLPRTESPYNDIKLTCLVSSNINKKNTTSASNAQLSLPHIF